MTDDLMRALVQGPGSQPGAERGGANILGQLLQGLMGGASLQGGATEEEEQEPTPQEMLGQGGSGMGGLLEAIMGGGMGGESAQSSAGTGGGLADILGTIMGGGTLGAGESAGVQSPAGSGSAGGLADILGAIMGGGMGGESAQSPAGAGTGGGLAGILGAIVGGGAPSGTSGTQSSPIINAIVSGLAEKLGLPPQLAQIVVTFVINKLLKGRAEAASAQQAPSAQPQIEGMNLDGLLDKVNRGQALRQSDLGTTGLVEELSQQTGLSSRDAAASLAYVFNELGSQYGSSAGLAAPSAPKPEGLSHLLDEW